MPIGGEEGCDYLSSNQWISYPLSNVSQKRKNTGDDERLAKKASNPSICSDQVRTSKKTPELLRHGMGKGLMTSQGPVAPSTITLLVRNKQHTVEMIQSIIKDEDLDECSKHEIEFLGESGLFNLMRVRRHFICSFFSYESQV